VLLPALLAEYADQHPRQLLRYAGQVWGLHRGAPQQRVSAAIGATAGFFQRMGLATRLSAHGLDAEAVAEILAQLQRRNSRGEPPGIDFHDPTQVAAHVAKLPAAAFVIVLAAWTIGSFAGGWVAAAISRHWPRACALCVAAFMLAGVAYNVIVLPHPLWMSVLGLLLPIPAALLGARRHGGRA